MRDPVAIPAKVQGDSYLAYKKERQKERWTLGFIGFERLVSVGLQGASLHRFWLPRRVVQTLRGAR